MSYGVTIRSLALAVALGFGLVACGGGGESLISVLPVLEVILNF